MNRVLLWIVIGAIAWFGWRFVQRLRAAPGRPGAGAGAGAKGRAPEIEAMVACHRCGTHVPASEAVSGHGGRLYCSVAHRDADR